VDQGNAPALHQHRLQPVMELQGQRHRILPEQPAFQAAPLMEHHHQGPLAADPLLHQTGAGQGWIKWSHGVAGGVVKQWRRPVVERAWDPWFPHLPIHGMGPTKGWYEGPLARGGSPPDQSPKLGIQLLQQ